MKTLIGRWIPLLLAFATVTSAQPAPKTAASINGEPIAEDQVLAAAGGNLQELETRRLPDGRAMARAQLAILHKALDGIAEQKLVALEAARQQTTPQQIVDAEITSNVVIPSDEDVAAAYEKNQASLPGPRDQALARLRQLMTERSRNTYRDALLRRLKREYGFKSYLDPLRTDVATTGYPSRGPMAAPVTIVLFSDFECPFCGALFPTLKAVELKYRDEVRLVYRQFPLTNVHPHAQKAAEASLCANDQGRFWEMHDSMFGFQEDLSVESLKLRATELRLDAGAFGACLDSGKYADTIKKDRDEASTLGVSGTPTLFVNGRILLGNQPAELQALITDELERSR